MQSFGGYRLAGLGCVCAGLLALGCAAKQPVIGDSFEFFAPARSGGPFYPKVVDWQERSRRMPERSAVRETVNPDTHPYGVLEDKFDVFLAEHRIMLARDFTAWSQQQARRHFEADPETALAEDHWPTREEFFLANGDDCDGLDLIAYGLLLDAGFDANEIYRLIVRRDSDNANHMVTLWFEDAKDPWVIDTTGAMTLEMRRFSELPPGWHPRVMFNDNEIYDVVERGEGRYELARDRAGSAEESQ